MIRVVHRGIGGAGTPGTVPKFTNTAEVADSLIAEVAGVVEVDGPSATIMRWRASGVEKMRLSNAGALVAQLSIETLSVIADSFLLGVDLALSASGTALRLAADATWATIELWAGGAARWFLTATAFYPVANGTTDLGGSANRIKDVWIAGEVVAPNEGKFNGAAQAAFGNVNTNITGLAIDVGPGETWIFDVVIPVTMVGALGVKFWLTWGGGYTIDLMRQGNIGSAISWQAHWTNVIGIPGAPFYCTFAGAGLVQMRATVVFTSGVGTVQVVGVTGGAGTTCAVARGASMVGKRIA